MSRPAVATGSRPFNEEGLSQLEIGRRKGAEYKRYLLEQRRQAAAAKKSEQEVSFQDTFVDDAPRRRSTGSRRNPKAPEQPALPESRRQSLNLPHRSYAPRRSISTREVSPDSIDLDEITGWEETAEEYDSEEVVRIEPRRQSTGSRRKVAVVESESRRQSLNIPNRNYASRRSIPTRELSPDSPDRDRTTGWDVRAADCYHTDEVRQIWGGVIEEEAPLVDRAPHIERIASPWRLCRTVLSVAVIAFVLNCTDYSPRHLFLGLATIITAEYLCDYSWFQALSGLSLGFLFTVCVVVLFVFRRYTKPSVIGGFFLLGVSRLNFIIHFVAPIAAAAGISTQILINGILGTSLVLMFIASCIWYCTSSFPVDNFRKFLKAFLTVGVGGGFVGFSFYHSREVSYLDYLAANHFIIPVFLIESAWMLNAIVVFGVAVLSLRVRHLSDVYDDIYCLYSDNFGPKRIQAVIPLCTRRSTREARRISEEFTKKELSKLQSTIRAMPDEILKETLNSETYLKIVHERETQGTCANMSWLLVGLIGALAAGFYLYMNQI